MIVQSRQYWDGGETELQAHGEICNPHGRCTVRGGDSSSKTGKRGETFGITVSFSFLELGLRLHVHLDESGDIHQLVQPQDTVLGRSDPSTACFYHLLLLQEYTQ